MTVTVLKAADDHETRFFPDFKAARGYVSYWATVAQSVHVTDDNGVTILAFCDGEQVK